MPFGSFKALSHDRCQSYVGCQVVELVPMISGFLQRLELPKISWTIEVQTVFSEAYECISISRCLYL